MTVQRKTQSSVNHERKKTQTKKFNAIGILEFLRMKKNKMNATIILVLSNKNRE